MEVGPPAAQIRTVTRGKVLYPSDLADHHSQGKCGGRFFERPSLNPEESALTDLGSLLAQVSASVQFQPPILCNFTPPLTNASLRQTEI